jgi:sulfatase maturation enzyme AslB (radical SAM superfamily)
LKNIKQLHLEITALCNAACPACARYPTSSYFVHPYISSSDTWTIEQVKKRLPPEDIVGITHFFFNGTLGDFIANYHALEIVEYFKECAPHSKILVNTNGSARTTDWWARLGSIPNVHVAFALDGLENTHNLYRRNTDWNTIIKNAQAFIQAGGTAEWVMTVFKHNEHQVDDCSSLAMHYGFKHFTSRFNNRSHVPVRNRNGKTIYKLESATNTPLTMLQDVNEEWMVDKESKFQRDKVIRVKQERIGLPLNRGKNDCGSLERSEIYISAQWAVVPCCFLGNAMFNKESDCYYDDIVNLAKQHGVDIANLVATDDRTVASIVNAGFDWVYESLHTNDALSICYRACNSKTAPFAVGQTHRTYKKL